MGFQCAYVRLLVSDSTFQRRIEGDTILPSGGGFLRPFFQQVPYMGLYSRNFGITLLDLFLEHFNFSLIIDAECSTFGRKRIIFPAPAKPQFMAPLVALYPWNHDKKEQARPKARRRSRGNGGPWLWCPNIRYHLQAAARCDNVILSILGSFERIANMTILMRIK